MTRLVQPVSFPHKPSKRSDNGHVVRREETFASLFLPRPPAALVLANYREHLNNGKQKNDRRLRGGIERRQQYFVCRLDRSDEHGERANIIRTSRGGVIHQLTNQSIDRSLKGETRMDGS